MMNLDQVRVIDPILTQLAQGYKNAEGVATFFGPAVSMNTRAGRTLVFGKEAFAAQSFLRAPGTNIQKIQNEFGTRSFALRQEAISWEIAEEVAAEAKNGAAQLDLRQYAAKDAANRLMQSWEVTVAGAVTDSSSYETSCVFDLATRASGADQFNQATSDIEVLIDEAKEAVRAQIGTYPNKMVISPDAFNALKRNKRIRDFMQRGVLVNEATLANIFGLDEIRVARRLKLNQTSGALENIYNNVAVLFYQPSGATDGFAPAMDANYGNPAFGYTYTLAGYPIATPERFNIERRVFTGDILVERSFELVGMGQNGKVGAGAILTNVVA
ncbi:capsid protein [Cyanophage S-TIM5]|jgi:hypothetical protein|uniref:Capsid protein n=4 Tax=Caudoviricetes TaxID=2731619 RepID=H6WFT4_9CAUD|nr:major head protein [Cyanophage S-TIM5]AEZ65659.1 capsid protein [Cyanophage S-TIM5]UYE96827.1 capsid [Cyanophage S-TIM66]UYE97040.1 capsid [Cyanophage S-TIM61]